MQEWRSSGSWLVVWWDAGVRVRVGGVGERGKRISGNNK